MRLILVVAVVTAVLVRAQELDQLLAPMSVCELIAHRVEYNGRVVMVRGEVKQGPHGAWMASLSDCQYKLITEGISWPNEIFLAYPNSRSPLEEFHANFEVDWKSVRRAENQLKHSEYDPAIDHVVETYVGRFVTYLNLENRVNSPTLGGNRFGFGPKGLDAPAQLLIKSIKEVTVIPGKR
jgi:hypothetical protein